MKKNIGIELLIITGVVFFLTVSCNKTGDNHDLPVSGIFDNAFDNSSTYPDPVNLIYTRKNGTPSSVMAYPGQVVMLTANDAASEVTQLITQNNGTVIAQIPKVGMYLVSIKTTDLKVFLSAVYKSVVVVDAFPNLVARGRGYLDQCGEVSYTGDQNSIIQTIDVSTDMGCSDKVLHKDAVGAVAGVGGVSVNVNDVTSKYPNTDSAGADSYKTMQKILERLNYAYEHNLPVIINISMGGDDTDEMDNYWYKKRFCYLLEAIEKQSPHLLNNAVIFMSGADVKRNETEDYVQLFFNDFGNSPIWDHLYFIDSQEGPNGCNLGYVEPGTPNALSAPGCHIKIPNSVCTRSGNSFSTPYISNLVARTYGLLKQAEINVSIPEITAKLWEYQTNNNGLLPTPEQLFSLFAGTPGFDNKYDGIWKGSFYYIAKVPQESGPPKIINASFVLTVTLESVVAVVGQPHYLLVKSVTCSDATFGATSPVVPKSPISIALLPASFGTSSLVGQGISIEFPNGSHIFTSNSLDGSFSIDTEGRTLASTELVKNKAFSAGGTVENSTLPGSGPGGYAYNWCTFVSWSLVRQ